MEPLKLPAVQLVTMRLEMLMGDLLSGTYVLETHLCVGFMLLVAMSQARSHFKVASCTS